MATTTYIDRTSRAAQEMTEAQRDAYEAVTENFAAAQRRGIGLAQDGLGLLKLQEDNARAAQAWVADGIKLLQHQQRNAEFVQNWAHGAAEAVREQADQNARTAEAVARGISRQQESFRAIAQGWTGAYRDFFSPFAYAQEGLKTFQRATQHGLEATEQVTRQGLRVAEQAAEQTEEVLRQTEEATRQVELEAAVMGSLKTADYDDLTVDEISKRLNGLSTEELKKVREYEKDHKDRETLVDQIDRKIRTTS